MNAFDKLKWIKWFYYGLTFFWGVLFLYLLAEDDLDGEALLGLLVISFITWSAGFMADILAKSFAYLVLLRAEEQEQEELEK